MASTNHYITHDATEIIQIIAIITLRLEVALTKVATIIITLDQRQEIIQGGKELRCA